MSFNSYDPNLSIYKVFSNIININDAIQKTQIPNLNIISACEDLAAAEYELADDDNRNYLLQSYIKGIENKYDYIFIDTAGIRKTHNKIETAGILMTKKSADLSTLTLYLVDDTVGFDEEDETILKNNEIDNFWIISNKIDLSSDPNPSVSNNCFKTIRLSILKNSGIDLLKNELSRIITHLNTLSPGF